jgi:metal-responsive CopG/Arc/MetJ family transcriptional regulator
MKTHSDNAVTIPPALLAEVQAAAQAEHRPADELVSDALRRYLQARNHDETGTAETSHAALTRSQIAGQRIRDLRKGVTLGGIPIKDLIEEGRE